MKKLGLALLEWLGMKELVFYPTGIAWSAMKEVGFCPTGMAWNGSGGFWPDWNGLESEEVVFGST
jgi:hypothetical protein